MNSHTRIKLEMARRARDFSRANPDSSPRYAETLARLEERLTRAEALASQQQAGRIAVHASVARRAQLRRVIREQPLRHLARIADAASKELPAVANRFTAPEANISHLDFLTLVRTMAKEAEAHRDVFISYGMPATFLEDLTALLNEYDQAVNEAHAGKSASVGAGGELKLVTQELMQLVQSLDAMHRIRFAEGTELLVAWESARNIAWPSTEPTPHPGEVKPAA